jgi:4-amino-4-deoxy-L-arabinose transferase-like glycosyltransferase
MSPAPDVADPGRLKLPARSNPLKLLSVLLVAIAAFGIYGTARVFSGTVDEPAHIAAGMQWLTTDRYDYDLQHPPLGRIAAALGPFLHGQRSTGAAAIYDEGARILGSGQHYVDTLASARHGELIFFFVLGLVVWAWSRRLTSDVGAAIGTAFLVTNPNILAHAGLATTDIACAATTTLALFAGVWWIDRPSWQRSALFGAAIGAAIASRLSSIAFVGGPLVVCYLVRWWSTGSVRLVLPADDRPAHERARVNAGVSLAAIGIATSLVVWAVYRFAFGQMHAGGMRVPAPAFFSGVETFFLHGGSGHPTYLLGTPSNRGWWYYFPVALLVKTPLPLLLFSAIGAAGATAQLRRDRDWRAAVPLVSAVTIVLISLSVRVNLGVRLVLPVYPLLAIVAAQGVAYLIRQQPRGERVSRIVAGAALASAAFIAMRAYPDDLAYFNMLAGAHPENVLVDSNLDWGQDLYRLRDTLAARGISDSVRVAYFGTANLTAAGVPRARALGLHETATGWVAASETFLAGEWVGHAYAWLLQYPPVARIGPSMRLWHIPPDHASPTTGSLPR